MQLSIARPKRLHIVGQFNLEYSVAWTSRLVLFQLIKTKTKTIVNEYLEFQLTITVTESKTYTITISKTKMII